MLSVFNYIDGKLVGSSPLFVIINETYVFSEKLLFKFVSVHFRYEREMSRKCEQEREKEEEREREKQNICFP